MSAALSSLTNLSTGIASAATDISSLFGGGAKSALTLGSITLQSFEVPETIRFANSQAIVLHQLPGGARVIDCLGPNPEPITWSGIMLGNTAASRAQLLQSACDAGKIVTLAWSTFSFDVIIDRFSGQIGWSRCDYSISCTIKPKQPATTKVSLQTGVLADVGGALTGISTAVTAATGAVTATVGAAETALGTVSSLTSAFGITVPGLSKIATDLSSVQSVANSASGLAEGASTVGSLLSSATAIGGEVGTAISSVGSALGFTGSASSIVTTAGQSGVLAGLSQAKSLIGRAATNLGISAAQPQTPASVIAAQNSGAGTVAVGAPTPLFTVQ